SVCKRRDAPEYPEQRRDLLGHEERRDDDADERSEALRRLIEQHPDGGSKHGSIYKRSITFSQASTVRNDGPSNPVLVPSTNSGAAEYGETGDSVSVSGYRDGNTYRIMHTGFNSNLFGSLGGFEGICMASITATCP